MQDATKPAEIFLLCMKSAEKLIAATKNTKNDISAAGAGGGGEEKPKDKIIFRIYVTVKIKHALKSGYRDIYRERESM